MMFDSKMTRRYLLTVAGSVFAAGCISRKSDRNTDVTTIADAWRHIHDWLALQAPKIVGNLNPPATDREVERAEAEFGCTMPEEWRDLYRVHNGMNTESNLGNLFCCMRFLSLEEAIRECKFNATPTEHVVKVRAADDGIRKADIYNPKWIAFAHDGGETLLRIDMDPDSTGNAGQVIFTDHADNTAILLARSLGEFMSQFVRDLDASRYVLNKEALVDGDHFLECHAEIDVINWAFSPRWKHLARR